MFLCSRTTRIISRRTRRLAEQETHLIFSGGNLDISLTSAWESAPFPVAAFFFRLVTPGNEAIPLQGTSCHTDLRQDICRPVDRSPYRVTEGQGAIGILRSNTVTDLQHIGSEAATQVKKKAAIRSSGVIDRKLMSHIHEQFRHFSEIFYEPI